MLQADRYRQFAETLTLAARDASVPTGDLILRLAGAWTVLACEAGGETDNVIDFAGAAASLRQSRTQPPN